MKKKILFLTYLALTTWLAVHHEPWRDEADSWLMARDATIGQILAIGPDSGHPPLWYFLLKPLAASGLPYAAQPALHLVIIWGAAWLLVFRSPFPWQVSAAVLGTYLFSFEYSVVARNYGLGILGLFLYSSFSHLEGRRHESARIAGMFIMSLASLFTLISAAILVLIEFTRANSRNLEGVKTTRPMNLWAMAAAVMAGALTLWPSGNGQFSGVIFSRLIIQAPVDSLSTLLMPRQGYHEIYVAVCGAWLLATGFLIFRRDFYSGLFFASAVMALFVLFASVHYQIEAPRYSGMIFVFAVAALWTSLNNKKDNRMPDWNSHRPAWYLITLFFAAQMPDTLSVWYQETSLPFTDAPAIAPELGRSGGLDKVVACSPPTNCESVLLRMPANKKFLYPGIGFGTHGFWDKKHRAASLMPADKALEWAKEFVGPDLVATRGMIFMSSSSISNPESLGFRELSFYQSRAWAVRDETFHIYSTLD